MNHGDLGAVLVHLFVPEPTNRINLLLLGNTFLENVHDRLSFLLLKQEGKWIRRNDRLRRGVRFRSKEVTTVTMLGTWSSVDP